MDHQPVTPMRIGTELVDHGRDEDRIIVVRSPYDGHEVGRVPRGTEADLDAAVAAAVARQNGEPLPAHERAAILDRAATILGRDDQRERFARLIAQEAAKPIKTARIEAARAADTFRFAATTARTLTGTMVPLDASVSGQGKLGFVLRVPIGVVAAISPFNFPLNLVAHKVAPAIAAGCAVVLKPASATPLTALALAAVLIDECGLPPGWLNVVTCSGATAEHLVTHPDVAFISFTGSPEVGWGIKAKAPRKKVGLELGNNAPVIIEPDADLDLVAQKISVAGYSHAGQSCISVQRVYVHDAVLDTFVGKLVTAVESLKVGDPLDETTDVSSLISVAETERVERAIAEAVNGGASVACGGNRTANGVLIPTVLVGVLPDMEVCRTEIFGPVVGVQGYSTFDEALELADDTRYGLQAGVFTNDLEKALRAARRLSFGGVLINEVPTWRADQMPYGGVRDSGNTREGPAYSALEMTETRLVVIS
ncbi:MAG: aldehyde dehydrogenase family protein [Acidimicrobiales bacterium]|nr:aldehyde dehydrogenase family protein [Acidimicrobiales bacterium]